MFAPYMAIISEPGSYTRSVGKPPRRVALSTLNHLSVVLADPVLRYEGHGEKCILLHLSRADEEPPEFSQRKARAKSAGFGDFHSRCVRRAYLWWRREWDSNPRYGFPHTRFPSVRLKPLGHLSGAPLLKKRGRFCKGLRKDTADRYPTYRTVSFKHLTQ